MQNVERVHVVHAMHMHREWRSTWGDKVAGPAASGPLGTACTKERGPKAKLGTGHTHITPLNLYYTLRCIYGPYSLYGLPRPTHLAPP